MNPNDRIGMLKQYLEEDPDDTFSRYALALEYIKNGTRDEAFRLMEDLVNNHPNYLPTYYHFGKLLEQLGDSKRARHIYETGIKIASIQNDQHTRIELEGALSEEE